MSDRSKGRGDRRGYSDRRDRRPRDSRGGKRREDDAEDTGERRPIILAKPERSAVLDQHFPPLEQTLAREGKSPSSDDQDAPSSPSTEAPPPAEAAKRIQQKETPTVTEKAIKPTGMDSWRNLSPFPDRSHKLIDEGHQFVESIGDFLTDNADFLVVGVIGLQNSGKSTVLNHLAKVDTKDENVFRVQSFEKQMLAEHCTNGVNVYVNAQRVIFIDCQAINSSSIMDRAIQLDKKYSSEFNTMENTIELHSLQLMGFLLNVCHAVLVVQDWFTDGNLIRLLHTAEMLKPSSMAAVEDTQQIVEYFPNMVFIQNKAHLNDISAHSLSEMQDFYTTAFAKSQLKIRSGVSMTKDLYAHLPDNTDETCINLFVMPDFDFSEVQGDEQEWLGFTSHLSFQDAIMKLRRKLFSMRRQSLTTSKLTEKQWLQFAQKSWENVKNSPFYMEYNKLL